MSFWKDLPQPIVGLAPMDGVTDAAFRFITSRHGRPDVLFTEFTAVERIVRGHDPDLIDLRYSDIERPVVAQVFGVDPHSFYQIAHIVCELGFDGLDINMGCPAKNVAQGGAGAGLIRTPGLARTILRRTRQGVFDWAAGQRLEAVGLPEAALSAIRRRIRRPAGGPVPPRKAIPVSVKTRLGYDEVIVEDWIRHLLCESPAAISLHGRTLTQQYRGAADWKAIAKAAEIARGSGTLLLGNGDLCSTQAIVERIKESGVNGVLLGRVALGNPWIFTSREAIRNAICTGSALSADPQVSAAQKLAVALEHAQIYEMLRGSKSFQGIRKYLAAYARGFPNASELRQRLVRIDSCSQLESVLAPAACV